MRICHVTTFFGAESFGGDAAYVDRLSRSLLARGHEVEVVHDGGAFELLSAAAPRRPWDPPPGLVVHRLSGGVKGLGPLWTHQTGRPGARGRALREILARDFDAVHFHNLSLVSGPGGLDLVPDTSRVLVTAHEHWLVCPLSQLWAFDRERCVAPTCVRCTLSAGRPPQLWRAGGTVDRLLRRADAVLAPSQDTVDLHAERGLATPMRPLPYFLPDGWAAGAADGAPRPYVAAAGRLVAPKGFGTLVEAMRLLPDLELRLAGAGPLEDELRAAAPPNVVFCGLLGEREIAALFAGARAVVVPSLFPETFGYVVLEAWAAGAPVVVHRGGGALAEVAGPGGVVYDRAEELPAAIRAAIADRETLVAAGRARLAGPFSETAHLDAYEALVSGRAAARSRRDGS